MSALESVQAALNGAPLDTDSLERISFDPNYAKEVRSKLAPMLVELASTHPETAQTVPESVIDGLFLGVSFGDVLKLTQLDASALDSPLVRPLLLKQLAEKAEASDSKFAQSALSLLDHPLIETSSVAYLEKLLIRVPSFTEYVPFESLFEGTAELKGRLMAINLELLRSSKARPFVPLNYLIWKHLEDPDRGDILLFVLQVDYVGELALLAARSPQKSELEALRPTLHEICTYYITDASPFVIGSLERTLARTAQADPDLFAQLDQEYSLVNHSRLNLIAQLPASYLVGHHRSLVESLELKNASLLAVANIAQEEEGLKLLPLTASKLRNLPVPSQLLIASCGTVSKEGAKYFADKFMDCLKIAYSAPNTVDTTDYLATLRANLSRWHIKVPREASVSTV